MTKTRLIPIILTLCAAVALDASARYKGDLNGDDRVDLADMVYLAKAIQSGSTDKALDVNASGSVDDYDLQRLADIIISGKLTEDSGMNVGIGGWEETDEDFGGTVKAPAFTTRSTDNTHFFMNNPQAESDGHYSMEFGISEVDVSPVAILFNIILPSEMRVDTSRIVELDADVTTTYKLYGTPQFIKENSDFPWSDNILRFILISPELDQLPNSKCRLGRILYSIGECFSTPKFVNCQVASSDGRCIDINEHLGDYSGNFKPLDVSSVVFDITEFDLMEGDMLLLWAYIDPWDAPDQRLVWTSSDESVATVIVSEEDDLSALIKALKAGVAVITATSSNGISASCTVTVTAEEIPMQVIILDADMLELEVGDTHQFIATVLPAETTYPELEWWTDDETVAIVDQNGFVTMVGEGTITVHVRSVRWPDIEATCRLNVTDAVDCVITDDAPCDIYTTNGKLLKQSVPTSEIRKLDRGLYIIRQRGKTTKLLK